MSSPVQPCPSQARFPGLKGMDWNEWYDTRLCSILAKQVAQWQSSKIISAPQAHGLEQALELYQQRPFSESGQCMEDGKLVFFQEARWFGSNGVRREMFWLTLTQCTNLLNSSQGMQVATSNLCERALWLFYINLHYRTVWPLYLSTFSWGLRPVWLKRI